MIVLKIKNFENFEKLSSKTYPIQKYIYKQECALVYTIQHKNDRTI